MSKFVTVVLCVLAAAVPVAFAGASPPIGLPALTRTASRLSGLAARRHIHVVSESAAGMRVVETALLDRAYPPAEQTYDEALYRALGLLPATAPLRPALLHEVVGNAPGLYDPQTHILYVRRGRIVRRALVKELVHALEDQTFDLRRLDDLRRASRDAAAAAAAAVEGDAAFATAGYGASTVETRAASPMETFLHLEHEFPYTTGLQFVATLHNLGGNRAIFSALRSFPQTTAQVFHIEAFLAHTAAASIDLPAAVGGMALAQTDTFGELDVRALLATFGVPRLDEAATGWAGGRTAVYRGPAGAAVVLALDWASALDGEQWAEAVTTYVNEAFDAATPGFPPTTPCVATVCWSVGGRSIAFLRVRDRTVLAFGPSVPLAADLAQAILGKG